jgi:hypothetical protein
MSAARAPFAPINMLHVMSAIAETYFIYPTPTEIIAVPEPLEKDGKRICLSYRYFLLASTKLAVVFILRNVV